MHSRIWLAQTFAAIIAPTLSITPLGTRQSEGNLNTSLHTLKLAGNISKTRGEAVNHDGGRDLKPLTLTNATQPTSNYSSLYDFEFETDSVAAPIVPVCDGGAYGVNIDKGSCFDAYRKLGLEPGRASWGPRGPAHQYQYRLPTRWSSDDGKCVIDVVHNKQYNSDLASLLDIGTAAGDVMKKCIDSPNNPSRGGFVGNVGRQGNLVVIVRKYTPTVLCGDRFDGWNSPSLCAKTLSEMPVSMQPLGFGKEGLPGVQWPLPWSYQAGGSRCEVLMRLEDTAQIETMRWFDIWAAAVAADAICVKNGRAGASPNIGEHRSGWVALKIGDAQLEPPSVTDA